MSRKKGSWMSEEALRIRKAYKEAYTNRIFNLWMNKYEVEGVSRDEREFILRRLWADGSVAAFPLIHPSAEFNGSSPSCFSELVQLGFAPFAINEFNMYSRPTTIQLINERGTPYIPVERQVVNRDAVIISASHTYQTPIKSMVEPFINRVVDIEMAIRTNVAWNKKVNTIAVTPENELGVGDFIVLLYNDEPVLLVNEQLPDSVNVIPSAGQFIIDKLFQYKKDVENEILTILGINNTPYEKRERLVVDEVNSNNEMIETTSAIMDDCLEESCALVKEVFGVSIAFRPKKESMETEGNPEEGNPEEEEKEDDTL